MCNGCIRSCVFVFCHTFRPVHDHVGFNSIFLDLPSIVLDQFAEQYSILSKESGTREVENPNSKLPLLRRGCKGRDQRSDGVQYIYERARHPGGRNSEKQLCVLPCTLEGIGRWEGDDRDNP